MVCYVLTQINALSTCIFSMLRRPPDPYSLDICKIILRFLDNEGIDLSLANQTFYPFSLSLLYK